MGTVFAVLSLVIAMISVWFTTEALKRVDIHSDAAIKPHIRDVNAKIREGQSLMNDIDSRLRRIEQQVEVLKIDHRGAQDLEQQTREIRKSVDKARAFVPSKVLSA